MRRLVCLTGLALCLTACGEAETVTPQSPAGTSPDTSRAADSGSSDVEASVVDTLPGEDLGTTEDAAPQQETINEEVPFSLTADGFADGDAVPADHACCNGNPAMQWASVPEDTKTVALIMDDPDANDFPHWAVFNLPSDAGAIPAKASGKGIPSSWDSASVVELKNGFGFEGYLGPCPPTNHTYRWRAWALGTELDPATIQTFDDLEKAAEAEALAAATFSATYGPSTPAEQATCDDN